MSRSVVFGACIAWLSAAACSKQEPPPVPVSTAPVPASTTAETPPSAAPVEPPAESSLSLKRGVLSLASQQATFQPCGEAAPLWVIDQTDGLLRETFTGQTSPINLYAEAHGERTPTPPDLAAAKGYRAAFILEEVLFATVSDASKLGQGCNEPAPNYIVKAQGNEPFWAVEVTTEKMTWRQPEGPKEIVMGAPQSQDSEGTVGFTGSADGHTLELFIDAQACRDSMSGAYFAYAARAVFDGKELKGCARVGE